MRGSRKHVLDWTDQPQFVDELLELTAPVACSRATTSIWMPRGHRAPEEAKLERFGPTLSALPDIWAELSSWWLAHRAGANTPNWDIALSCEIEGRSGLLLVEAKANEPELTSLGKSLDGDASKNSRENHARIGEAISEANQALGTQFSGLKLASDAHYQLANRIAFAWKLASLGVPTVLMYLGFTGDAGITDAGTPFRDHDHWASYFRAHLGRISPTSMSETRIDCGAAPFWLLVRSKPVLEESPPRPQRATTPPV